MAWRIEIDKDVQRSMRKLDRQIAKRIVAKLREIRSSKTLGAWARA